jgi:hypothetical protein
MIRSTYIFFGVFRARNKIEGRIDPGGCFGSHGGHNPG